MNLANQLRNNLIHRIENIDDVNFLQAIQTILDSSNKELHELTDDQKESIRTSRRQLDNGQEINHDDVMSNLSQWLKNK
ncbi:hypothetical protein N8482_02025 [Chitinophagales bacterium]|nr:hypothetical protein [Chitinophagales bacterium]